MIGCIGWMAGSIVWLLHDNDDDDDDDASIDVCYEIVYTSYTDAATRL